MNKHIYIKFIENDEIIFHEKINIDDNFYKAKNIFDTLEEQCQICKLNNELHVEASIDPVEIMFQNFVIKYLYPLCENLKNIWKKFDIEFVYLYLPINYAL
ncbi:hypothetical protein [Proteus sp. G2674]|uniref:hypothetical protein n=1 Tax=Proteus sp. G2674 TaxID=2698886 RepID=UPI001376A11E|nr:hypothetical protein [Proteus sp. G2674]NBL83777.1 hypothetical protein [Proteus sp. G2674]